MTMKYETKYSLIEYSKSYGTLWITSKSTDEVSQCYIEPKDFKNLLNQFLKEME